MEQIVKTRVYSPGGTNDDIVTTVTGKMFVAESPESFTYDSDGNLLSDGRWNYVWDAENRLVGMETMSGLPTNIPVIRLEFDYDYMSRRIAKRAYSWNSDSWLLTSEYSFLYDSWNLISEQTHQQTNTQTNFFTWGLDLSGSLQGAGGVGGLLSAIIGTNSVCYTFDGNGNVSELVNCDTAAIDAHYEYSPFGEQLVAVGPLARENPFRFSTKYTDNETRVSVRGSTPYARPPGCGKPAA